MLKPYGTDPNVKEVARHTAQRSLQYAVKVIKLPDDCSEARTNFYKVAGYPDVVGSIDRGDSAVVNGNQYRSGNHIGYFSINVQVM